MNNIIYYKDYFAKIEFSSEDKVLYGKIEGINDLVTFESASIDGIEKEFHDAVDSYLEMCEDLGQEPDKVYKGSFNVRISAELHREIAMRALKEGESLNSVVEKAIRNYVNAETSNSVKEIWMIPTSEIAAFKDANYTPATSSVAGVTTLYSIGGC